MPPVPFPVGYKRATAMVVLRHDDEFLLLRRNKAPHIGKYVPVGGKVEPFEDPHSAALRETQEETGLQLQDLQYAGTLIETSPIDYNWQSSIYVADIDQILPPFCDEGTLEWIDFDDITDIPTPETDYQVYVHIMQGRPFAFNAIYDEKLRLISMDEELSGKRLTEW